MLEAHPGRRLRDALRLIPIGDRRPAGLDGAEPAVPGADGAEDHEGRRAQGPALAHVWTARLLADGVQAFSVDQLLQSCIGRPCADPDLEPIGPAAARPRVLGHRVTGGEELAEEPDEGENGDDVQADDGEFVLPELPAHQLPLRRDRDLRFRRGGRIRDMLRGPRGR